MKLSVVRKKIPFCGGLRLVRKSFVILLSILLFFSACANNDPQNRPPEAVKGIIDFTNWDFSSSGSVSLKGQWEFYPKQLLTSENFVNGNSLPVPSYIAVPGSWEGQKIDGEKVGNIGYATYRLTVLLPDDCGQLGFKPGAILTAYRMYLDGNLVSERGIVSADPSRGKPLLLIDSVSYSNPGKKAELILQISNYNHRISGPWDKIEMGSLTYIHHRDGEIRDADFMIIGALLMMGLFFLSMFIFRRNEISSLYFSLFCLVIALRVSLQSGVGYFSEVFPWIEWEIINKIEYITIYLSLPFFILFTLAFFRDRILQKLFWGVSGISIVFTILTLFTSSIFHSRLIPIYQIVLLVSGSYVLFMIIKRSFNEDLFARILLVGTFLLFATTINDILYSAGIISTAYLVSYGLLIFIMLQAYILTIRFIDVFNSVERQKKQLIKTNAEYRNEIDARIKTEADLLAMNENLVLARSAIILGLAKIAEYRDTDTGSHLTRIKEFNRVLALQLTKNHHYSDYITLEYINDLCESSILHDIGKVGVPDSVLLKPGKLTPEEFEIIKSHPVIGGDTIMSIEKNIHAQTFLTLGREIAYMHHEKWDGSGYPRGLAGEKISLSARITALSDVYDALTTKRCYKAAFSHEKAKEIITEGRGTHFDPDIVDAFIAVENEFARLSAELQDS